MTGVVLQTLLCGTVTLMWTLISYFAIVFSLILITTNNWFLFVRWLSVLFLFSSCVKLEHELITTCKNQ